MSEEEVLGDETIENVEAAGKLICDVIREYKLSYRDIIFILEQIKYKFLNDLLKEDV